MNTRWTDILTDLNLYLAKRYPLKEDFIGQSWSTVGYRLIKKDLL